MKVLVLGSTGMIGHKIYQVLSQNKDFEVFNASKSSLNCSTRLVDLRKLRQLEKLLENIKPDIVINASGLLIKDSEENPLDAVKINSVLPLELNNMSKNRSFKIIQISTDCVFSGDSGPYNIADFKDAKTVYGQTKSLGEIIDPIHLTIRTSVIGPDLKFDGGELFNWFMHQSGNVQGYSKSIWSGVTTLELAKCIEHCILNDVTGLHHLSSRKAITKYDLLSLLSNYSIENLFIEKVDGPITNKVLVSDEDPCFQIKKPYKILIEEMINDIVKCQHYSHYRCVTK